MQNIIIEITNTFTLLLSIITTIIDFFNKYSGFFGLLISIFAIISTYVIFKKTVRPIICVEIIKQDGNNTLSTYNLVISNVGNMPAKNIKYELVNDSETINSWNNQYNNSDEINSIESIKNRLNGYIYVLKNSFQCSGFLLNVYENNSPLIFENKIESKDIKILVTYEGYVTNRKHKEYIKLNINDKKDYLTGLQLINKKYKHFK